MRQKISKQINLAGQGKGRVESPLELESAVARSSQREHWSDNLDENYGIEDSASLSCGIGLVSEYLVFVFFHQVLVGLVPRGVGF